MLLQIHHTYDLVFDQLTQAHLPIVWMLLNAICMYVRFLWMLLSLFLSVHFDRHQMILQIHHTHDLVNDRHTPQAHLAIFDRSGCRAQHNMTAYSAQFADNLTAYSAQFTDNMTAYSAQFTAYMTAYSAQFTDNMTAYSAQFNAYLTAILTHIGYIMRNITRFFILFFTVNNDYNLFWK